MSASQLAKVSGTAAAWAGGLTLWEVVNSTSITLFGVTPAVFFTAGLGALLSFAYTPEGEAPIPKRRVYTLVVVNTILAAAIVSVFPEWLGWGWFNSKIEGSVALLLAVVLRFTAQLVIDAIPGLVVDVLRKWLKLPAKTRQEEPNTKDGL